MKDIVRALVGLVLVFSYHIPKIICYALQRSYAQVFNDQENLTADPKVHLQRARKLLRGHNSQLLYAALEVRFALERVLDWELVLAEKATVRSLQEYDPVKKLKALRRIDGQTAFPHKVYLVNPNTGERFEWGQYTPLDDQKVSEIKGRLGALLHPQRGLNLGISTDPWYAQTRTFLSASIGYLEDALKDNTPFFTYEGNSRIEMVRIEDGADVSHRDATTDD